MHCRTLIILLFSLVYPLAGSAQPTILTGYVFDHSSGEPLIGATVYDSLSGTGAVTNEYGYFGLPLRKDTAELLISYVGYTSRLLGVGKGSEAQRLHIGLKAAATLPEVMVKKTRQPGQAIPLSLEQIKRVPALAGETDVLKAYTLAPGVSSNVEGSANLMVRGGSFDQNLILLDGATVYNPVHLAGFLSVFNPYSVKRIDFFKSGMPARFGGRLSSVVDVYMKEGNMLETHGEAGAGLTSAKVALEGPLIKEKLAYHFSGRSSFMGALATLFQDDYYRKGLFGSRTNYLLYDLNFKMHYRPDSLQQFFLSAYSGQDDGFVQEGEFSQVSNTTRQELNWGNNTLVLRHHRVLRPGLFAKAWLVFTRYNYRFNDYENIANSFANSLVSSNANRITTSVQDITAKFQLDYYTLPNHQVKFGQEVTAHRFLINSRNLIFPSENAPSGIWDSLLYQSRISNWEWALFVEDEWQFSKRANMNIGLRWSGLFWDNNYTIAGLEPRIALLWEAGSEIGLRLAYDRTRQNLHLIQNGGIGFPNNIWLPASRQAPPSYGDQWSVGVTKGFLPSGLSLSIMAYYRSLYGLIELTPTQRSSFNFESNWEEAITTDGYGENYGLEVGLQKTKGTLTGMASYAWSFANRTFPEINQGRPFPFTFDRRHNIALSGHWQISAKWELASAWVYQSGIAATLPVAATKDYFIYGEINDGRLPDYHRLDLSATFTKTDRQGRQHQLYYSLYNAYNRRNPLYLEIQPLNRIIELPNGETEVVKGFTVKQISLFPIIPGFGYNYKF